MTASCVGTPLSTLNGVTASSGVHELRMKRQHRLDVMLLQPCDQPVNVDEIAIDALQMDDVRLLFLMIEISLFVEK